MKQLIIINGTIGVGKSTVSHMLRGMIEPVAYIDGDWCWNITPDKPNQEALLTNLTSLLKTYLHSDFVENIILDWSVYDETLIEALLARISDESFQLHKFTLICSEHTLRSRLVYDVTAGRRDASVVAESVAKMPLFENMSTDKIELGISGDMEAARHIAAKVLGQSSRLES